MGTFFSHSMGKIRVLLRTVNGGKRIAEALGPHRAVILRNHGLLTVGDGVEEAVGSFVQMERVAEVHMKAKGAKPISPAAARYAQADMRSYGPGRIAFFNLVLRHIPDPEEVLADSVGSSASG